ncbi:MAG: hypothetical protein ACJ74H_15270 [Thermoanaerobaculia bacterium]
MRLKILLAALLLPIVAVVLFSPFYQTNDDVAMRLIAEGHFVPDGKPLPFLMHVNVAIGALLSLAYRLVPRLPWYDLLMGAGMTAAAMVLLRVWSGTGKLREFVWAGLFALFFLLPAFVAVQFSLVGLGCAAAGMAFLVRACVEPLEDGPFRRHLLEGGALLVFGALVRFEGAVLMILEGTILAVPFVIGAWLRREQRPRLRPVALAFGAACVLILTSFAVNQYVYARAAGWEEFHEYNLRRSRISEYISPERITPEAVDRLARQVGWSGTDFTLFRNWFFTDPNLYNLRKVRTAEALFFGAGPKPTEESRASRMKRGAELAKSLFVETQLALVFMLVFMLSAVSTRYFLYALGVVLTIAVLITGITVALKAPEERIFWPMLVLGASMLPIAARRWGKPRHPAVAIAALAVACYVTVVSVQLLWKQSAERRVKSAIARQDAQGLLHSGGKFFVLHGNAFPYEDYWRPLHVETTPFPFVALGVSARTPPVQDSLRRAGRTDLPLSLCREEGLLIVAPPYIPVLLTTFMAEHHGMQVRFDPIFTGQRLTAYKCTALSKGTADQHTADNQ